MDDLVLYRRKRNGQFSSNDKFGMKIQPKDGRITIFKSLADKIGVCDGDAVMFGFSKKVNSAFVFKEDEPLSDNYVCKFANGGRQYFRFTSKDLTNHFVTFFDLKDDDSSVYFEIDGCVDEKGYLKLKPFKKQTIKFA